MTTVKDGITTEEKTFFFLDKSHRYAICTTNIGSYSDRSVDLSFEELATNRKFLETLGLRSLYAGSAQAATFLTGEISAVYPQSGNSNREKLERNPMVRILFMDEKLYKVAQDYTAVLISSR